MYFVGYFEGPTGDAFQVLRQFETELDARDYVEINYIEDSWGEPQNVAIMHQNKLIFDGRWVRLN